MKVPYQPLVQAVLLEQATLSPEPDTSSLSPSKFKVNVGDVGPWEHPDDTPAFSYIDKDGTYYFQSAVANYKAEASRKWSFWTGTDIDHSDTAEISHAVNPNNPLDSNANTTWRCNNSPTGKLASYLEAKEPWNMGYSQKNYCDLMGVWVDPDDGSWYGVIHNEFTPEPFGDWIHYDAIDLAVSTDQGYTWTIKEQIITSHYSTIRGDNTSFPQQTFNWGAGDARLTVDLASGYFYIGYGSRIVDKGGSWEAFYSHAARAPMSGKLAAGTWHKYYRGEWSEPGKGGKESNLEPITSGNQAGYTPPEKEYDPNTPGKTQEQIAAGKLAPNSPLFWMDISFNTHLGLWIGEPRTEGATKDAQKPTIFYATDDLTRQQWTEIGDTGHYATNSAYRFLLDAGSRTSGQYIGKDFRAYCSYGCSNGSNAEYVNVAIDTDHPHAPVDAGKTYTIGTAERLLSVGPSGSATSVSKDAGNATWTFTPTGDGAYTIQDKDTGALLGVSADSPAHRAWGTVPVAAKADAADIGHQWFVIENRSANDNKRDGTFRLINRYSGLALALSDNDKRLVETTPGRAWDASQGVAVGGGRKAAEQVITLAPVA